MTETKPEEKKKSIVLEALLDKRDSAMRMIHHWTSQVNDQAKYIADIRIRHAAELKSQQERLEKCESNLQEYIAEREIWDVAIRTLRLLAISGDADAIAAITPEGGNDGTINLE
jgi:negative regulator of sigma E activity